MMQYLNYENVDNFIRVDGLPNNSWFIVGPMEVYLRKSCRFINSRKMTGIDIANVHINNVKFQKKGIFTEFLSHLEEENSKDYIYVENILNPILLDWLINKRHYTVINTESPSVYKIMGGK